MSYTIDYLTFKSDRDVSQRTIDNMELLLEEERRAVLRQKEEERYRSEMISLIDNKNLG